MDHLESVWPWWIRLGLKDVTGLAVVGFFIFFGLFFIMWHFMAEQVQNVKMKKKIKKIYRLKDKKTKSERKIESETEIQTEEQYEKFNELNVILKKGEDLALKEKS